MASSLAKRRLLTRRGRFGTFLAIEFTIPLSEFLHPDVQQVVGETPDEQGLQFTDQTVHDVIGAEVSREIVEGDCAQPNLSLFFIRRPEFLATLRVLNAPYLLDRSITIVGIFDLSPECPLAGLARVEGAPPAVVEDINAMMGHQLFL